MTIVYGINEFFTKSCMLALCSCRMWNLHILRTQGYIYLTKILERYHLYPWRPWKLDYAEPEYSITEWEQFGKIFSRNTLTQNIAGVNTYTDIALEVASKSTEYSLSSRPGSLTNLLNMKEQYRMISQDVVSKVVDRQISATELEYQYLRSLNVLTVKNLFLRGLKIHDRFLVTLLPKLQNLRTLSLAFIQIPLAICKWDEVLVTLFDLPQVSEVSLRGLAYGDPLVRRDSGLFYRTLSNSAWAQPNLERPRDMKLEVAGHIACHMCFTTIMCSNREEDYLAVNDVYWAYEHRSNDQGRRMDFCFHGDNLEKRMIKPRRFR